jgi:peptidoglycan/xylan/chitin deacetylase (PgdA/CDA1 family)
MKRRIKAVAGYMLYRSAAYRRRWRDQALVVLFHRVDDRYPTDPITVTRAAFESYLDFFTNYFQVVSLTELLAKLAGNDDISRHLVITFDDGYLDNWAIAAPELAARGLPACFFVATGFVGSDRNAWWDAARGLRSEWMTWDQVRDLKSHGFELGAHTISHVNLRTCDHATALREIMGSKTQLETETKCPVQHFAYPFGGVDHLIADQLEIIKAMGFASCLSAYGGTVRPGDDPYRLRRLGINSFWFRSPYQFGLECMSGATTPNTAAVPNASALVRGGALRHAALPQNREDVGP